MRRRGAAAEAEVVAEETPKERRWDVGRRHHNLISAAKMSKYDRDYFVGRY
jgi:hypothetical protein